MKPYTQITITLAGDSLQAVLKDLAEMAGPAGQARIREIAASAKGRDWIGPGSGHIVVTHVEGTD